MSFPVDTTIVFHYGRCGSTVIGRGLQTLHNVEHMGEFYYFGHWSEKWKAIDHLPRHHGANNSPKDAVKALETCVQHCLDKNPDLKHVVLEVKADEFWYNTTVGSVSDFLKAFKQAGGKNVVHLTREDILRWQLSIAKGAKQQVWHADTSPDQVVKVHIDTQQLAHNLEKLPREYVEFKKATEELGLNRLDLSYEHDVQQDPRRAIRKIADFIGAPHANVNIPITLQRTNPFVTWRSIENLDEVKSFLSERNLTHLLQLPHTGIDRQI